MVSVEHLTVQYSPTDPRRALEDVSFRLEFGTRAALLGANGAGKSTLLLTLVGLLPAQSGAVTVDGLALSQDTLTELRRRVGLVFQNPDDQLFMPTVWQDVAFGPRNYGVSEPEIERRGKAVLEALGIGHLRDRMVHKLSGGEKRLAALAGVLVMKPSVLLLDEPSSFLDPEAAGRLAECLGRLDQSLLLATHDLAFAAGLCGQFLFLARGRLVGDYSLADLREQPELLKRLGYPALE